MESQEYALSFPGASADEAGNYARDLKDFLLDEVQDLGMNLRKEQSETQDFGSTLVLLMGTGAATAVARGVSAWLKRNSGVKITIRDNRGVVIAENLDSRDAAEITKSIFSKPRA